MDMNSIKEPQSRLRKWTTVDSISVNTSLDQNSSKHGIKYILSLKKKKQNKTGILNLGLYFKYVLKSQILLAPFLIFKNALLVNLN